MAAAEKSAGSGCKGCGSGLGLEAVMGGGGLWHPDCFVCGACGGVVKEAYLERGGKIYCLPCNAASFNPKCSGCDAVLADSAVSADDRHWHPHCFVCARCAQPLSTEFYIVDGRHYDLNCHWHVRLKNFTANSRPSSP